MVNRKQAEDQLGEIANFRILRELEEKRSRQPYVEECPSLEELRRLYATDRRNWGREDFMLENHEYHCDRVDCFSNYSKALDEAAQRKSWSGKKGY